MMGASAAHMTATEVPACFRCPISLDIMRDPVSLCTGVTYERSCIERWLSQGHRTCPATKEPLLTLELIPNHTLRRLIQHWCASLLFSEVPSSRSAAAHTLRKLRLKSCKSDTHRNILNDSRFISLLIRILLSDEGDDAADAAESEAAGLLALALAETHMHIERDGHAHKKQAEALRGPRLVPCLDRLLRRGDRNAVSLIEVLSRDRIFARMLSHLLEPLLHMLAAAAGTFTSASPYEPSLRRDEQSRRENIASHRAAGTPAHEEELSARAGVGVSLRWQQGPSLKEDDAWATQQEEEEEKEEDEEEREDEDEEAWRTAAVGAVQNMCRVGRGVRVRVAEAGGVRAVTEVLNWSESALLKTKCLGVLESVSATAEGRAAIDDHTLCVPAVVRCVPRVSDEANEYAVGFLWQMFVKCADNDLVLNRSLLEMAMKKLLVLVQIDSCSPSTKLKANHLLKRFSSCLPTRSTTSH